MSIWNHTRETVGLRILLWLAAYLLSDDADEEERAELQHIRVALKSMEDGP